MYNFKKVLVATLFLLTLSENIFAENDSDIYLEKKNNPVEEFILRKNNDAVHIYMDESAPGPYAIFAFPAGNSGTALWLKAKNKGAGFHATTAPQILRRGAWQGAEVEIKSATHSLEFSDSVLGSMRFIRDRENDLDIPKEIHDQTLRLTESMVSIERKSLNRLVNYRLEIEPLGDTKIVKTGDSFSLESPSEIHFKLSGFSGEKALTAISARNIFKEEALKKIDPQVLKAFSFLLYREKLMAGSPRYLSKFGRDSLITLRVLMPMLKPEAIESLLAATLNSMDPRLGLISHEQSEGDFASWERKTHGQKYIGVSKPFEEYEMIDEDFLFTIVMGQYINDYPQRVKGFLSGRDSRGLSFAQLVNSNFKLVRSETGAFTRHPIYQNLIRLRTGHLGGQWRDSDNGLAGGVYPFDVNAALVPAALHTLSDIYGLKNMSFFNKKLSEKMRSDFTVWNTRVLPFFVVKIPAQKLPAYGETYLRSLKIDPTELPPSPSVDITFSAVSLDVKGQPIPIMNSDDSMMMTFGFPTAEYLQTAVQRIDDEFPYGLHTPVGILVANPVFAPAEMWPKFDEKQYHGRVSWTFQEELLDFGFERQMNTAPSLSPELRQKIQSARKKLAQVIAAKAAMRDAEVFTVTYKNKHFSAAPLKGDNDKSNSIQLWSFLHMVQ